MPQCACVSPRPIAAVLHPGNFDCRATSNNTDAFPAWLSGQMHCCLLCCFTPGIVLVQEVDAGGAVGGVGAGMAALSPPCKPMPLLARWPACSSAAQVRCLFHLYSAGHMSDASISRLLSLQQPQAAAWPAAMQSRYKHMPQLKGCVLALQLPHRDQEYLQICLRLALCH